MLRSFRQALCRSRARAARPWIELLEDRTLLAVAFTPAPYEAPVNRPDIAPGTGGISPVEPFVSINPTDPGSLALSSQNRLQLSANAGAAFPVAVTFPVPAGSTGAGGDTTSAFDAEGRLFWTNLARFPVGRDVAVTQLNPQTGAPVGSTSRVPNPLQRNDDKQWLVADSDPAGISPHRNNLYVTYARFNPPARQFEVFVARSTNQAATWTNVTQLSNLSEGFTWGSMAAVAPNGDVYVAYHSQPDLDDFAVEVDGFRRNPDGASGQVIVLRSTDGGVTFPERSVALGPGQADITFNAQDASNGGNIPGTRFWTLGSSQPYVLVDPVRPGNIYIIAADDPDNVHGSGDDADLVIARSTDFGQTWTASTIESGPVDQPDTINNSFQLFPMAAIDRFGNLVVAWYDDRRGLTNSAGRYELDLFGTYSIDGGLTWAPAFPVSDPSNPFDPDPGALTRFTGPPPTTRIGEYFGLDLFGGTAYVAWNGNAFSSSTPVGHQVWFSTFAVRGALAVSGTPGDDVITLRSMPGNADFVEVVVNGQREYAGLWSALTAITINGLEGTDFVIVSDTAAGTEVFIDGGDGLNAVFGPDSANAWYLTGADTGVLFGADLASPVSFQAVGYLVGGAADDTFVFLDGTTLSGYIDGQGGVNTLDYSTYQDHIYVILPLYLAYGVSGGVYNIRNVVGTAGPFINVLVGDGTGNTLVGGSGRDLLIAGFGPALLIGGGGEDLLIGGATAYDSDPVALTAILYEWLREDISYAERIAHLTDGGGVSDPYLLNTSTVFGNGGGNVLIGEGELDWFLGNFWLDPNDWDPLTEVFTLV